jgi:hypothetical protein
MPPWTGIKTFVHSLRHKPKRPDFPLNENSVVEREGADVDCKESDSNHDHRSILLQTPIDTLLLILDLLPLPSQACLALSCKALYQLFSSVLKDERLAWPRLLAARTYTLPGQDLDDPRTQLLVQLEDGNWLYCRGCLKIHPQTQFPRDSAAIEPPKRSCKYKAAVVDVCPCLA